METHSQFLKSLFSNRNSSVKDFMNLPSEPLNDGGVLEDQKVMDSLTIESIVKGFAMCGDKEAKWYYSNKGYLKKLD